MVNEVAVSRRRIGEGIAAARVLEDVDQPVVVGGHPVTFWHLITAENRKATYGELGSALATLHSPKPPSELRLPRFDVFGRADLRIERADVP
ncbi:hypothetical protein OG711_33205 [Streptomyces uncialis]|uniref:hypothetical protein n=1 Tax=Streptomyces uncialis TaxID=1048205 RepID=UPI002E3563FB|nr:hypothetical protein [Streptomyces uncialis]